MVGRAIKALTRMGASLSWRIPFARVSSSISPVVLLYHGIPRKTNGDSISAFAFEQHVSFLKKHFEIVRSEDVGKTRRLLDRIQVILTFDDGFKNNAEVVVPILHKFGLPAIFFISSRHATPGKYLWFSYVRGLEKNFRSNGFNFDGSFWDMSQSKRGLTMKKLTALLLNLTPHPSAMYEAIDELPRLEDFINCEDLADTYEGMNSYQVSELAKDPLFTIGCHTVDHPFLSRCSNDEATRQIRENKDWIERNSERPCNVVAYPSGDYNAETLEICNALGFIQGHSVEPTMGSNKSFEIPRIGLYSPALQYLGCKVQWGNMMRRLNVRIG